jgi:hypothetical protein
MENALKVVMYEECKGFRAVFYIKLSPKTREIFKCTWRIRQKYSVLGEYAKSILPYSPNTPKDIELSISQRIVDQREKNFKP